MSPKTYKDVKPIHRQWWTYTASEILPFAKEIVDTAIRRGWVYRPEPMWTDTGAVNDKGERKYCNSSFARYLHQIGRDMDYIMAATGGTREQIEKVIDRTRRVKGVE